jgi:hypothetical protein
LAIAVGRIFLDTNVFLYAVGADSPHRESCRALLSAVGNAQLDGVTSSEVLQEILHVRSRRVGMKDAVTAVRAAAAMVAEVLPVTLEDVLSACKLLERRPQIAPRDALHVAVMKSARILILISVDKDFDALKEVRRLHPRDALVE